MGKPARKSSREDKVLADISKGFQGFYSPPESFYLSGVDFLEGLY